MQEPHQNLLGVGIYTVQEAARLTGVPSRRIRRWLRGYVYRRDEVRFDVPAVWHAQIQPIDGATALGFLDLMEARFVDAFRRSGVSWNTIRLAAERAREIFEQDHPFSTRRFRTDGRRIFAEFIEKPAERKLLDLVKSQYAFHKIVSPSLYAGVEFSVRDEVIRWFPDWPKQQIVIDPHRAFGRPIVVREGVPTEVLAKAFEAEDSLERVAKWFAVPPRAVRDAVAFERGLDA